jgi:D-alanyl-D-alanine carboxypeptidase/D-alanyl-D-alanine-endopeptidase (penicillin-binding protein 4)
MRKILFAAFFFWIVDAAAQTVAQNLSKAYKQFENDAQLKHAVSSLYVIDGAGQPVFDKNSQTGLAPASTQKIITAATAFELLGKNYRYQTELGYYRKFQGDLLREGLIISGSGDPTLGSSRWRNTTDTIVLKKWADDIKKAGIKILNEILISSNANYSRQVIPDGWIWQDVGNYYGAAAGMINWKENQYDIVLRSSREQDGNVEIISPDKKYINELKTGAPGSGDNAYVYYNNVIAGTIPPGQRAFKISAANTDPASDLASQLITYFSSKGISWIPKAGDSASNIQQLAPDSVVSSHFSPPLDSIIYWFLQRSINLYGEALIKTISSAKTGFGSTDSGIAIIKKFWKQKGIDEDELNIGDGSGLSPQNRVTTHAQVEILKYAKKQAWFSSFYNALPEYNNMKMKSGTIRDVKGFCGYHKATNGKEYIFSFLVNNYNGSSSDLMGKMYKVLNVLR